MNTLTINAFVGGSTIKNKDIATDLCVIRDPRESLPENWTGFEVITAKDGGKRITWSTLSLPQIAEAKQKFEELIAEGLVPYYIDPDTGTVSEIVMDEFDPTAAAVEFEKTDFDPKNVLLAPTRLAMGG